MGTGGATDSGSSKKEESLVRYIFHVFYCLFWSPGCCTLEVGDKSIGNIESLECGISCESLVLKSGCLLGGDDGVKRHPRYPGEDNVATVGAVVSSFSFTQFRLY